MDGKHLLDTNVVIALFAGDSIATDFLEKAEEVFIPSIVIGELYYGARKSNRVQDNMARVNEFATSNVVLGCDTETAYWYGLVKDKLRQKGHPIPENDIWIAALALQYDLTLATYDAHFTRELAKNTPLSTNEYPKQLPPGLETDQGACAFS